MSDYDDPTPTSTPATAPDPGQRIIRTLIQALVAFGVLMVGATIVISAVEQQGLDVPDATTTWALAIGAGATAAASVVQNTWNAWKGKP